MLKNVSVLFSWHTGLSHVGRLPCYDPAKAGESGLLAVVTDQLLFLENCEGNEEDSNFKVLRQPFWDYVGY